MALNRILVVDGDREVHAHLRTLGQQQLAILTATSAANALALLGEAAFDLVLTELRLPGVDGNELMRFIHQRQPDLPVAVMTDYPHLDEAVELMRRGAIDYLSKPIAPQKLKALLSRIVTIRPKQSRPLGHIVAASPAMQQVLATVERVAPTDATVFITGESGTGKEVIAQAIHSRSRRCNQPYVRVNCAAVPDTLIESEFFGYERGAFTGAVARKAGRFELAHGGSLLLDEVTEIPLPVQPKLLRALQEQEFERVGGTRSVVVDVRLIATSNRDIDAAVAQQLIREDLYYRLNVIAIHLPTLRERQEDIIPLAEHFLAKLSATPIQLTPDAEQALLTYPWPGNIRELANILERAVVLANSTTLDAAALSLSAR